MKRTVIFNGRLITPHVISGIGYLIVDNGKIVKLGKGMPKFEDNDLRIDAKGNYISPGFIDIHTHGAGGYDFMDGTVEAYLGIAKIHAKYGTTALLPTTLTSTNEELLNTFKVYKEANKQNEKGAQFLGLHLEGPYFSYAQRGAQDPKYLRNPRPDEYMKILDSSDDIARWSIAPELEGAFELGRILNERGIVASVGHTDAVCDEVIEAHKNGYSLMTHLYSGMSTIIRKEGYRYAGALEAAFLLDDMNVEIIADGVHLPKNLLQFVFKFKGADKIALITDSMRGAGMSDGYYNLGSLKSGQKVLVEKGVAKLLDRSAFAGSVATADRLIRTMVNIAEVSLLDAVKMLTLTPARIMHLDAKKGTLEEGKDADILIFDEEINIQNTFIGGQLVYSLT